ncbi:MAG TPA: carbohydrate ABC transporter permease [Ktedonobacterales bacterium]|nr:carbohydrate ABC transporter permease [Ktedonobacterales bacterium]
MLLQHYLPKKIRRRHWRGILLFILMGAFTLLMISPVLWMISASFQNQAEMYQTPFQWIPEHLLPQNYVAAWINGNLGSAFLTSLEVVVLYVPVHVFLATITGYVFAKFHFRGRNLLFLFILITLLIPQETTYFPIYDLVRDIGWLNSPQGVVLPFLYSAFGIFLMRQFALSIPDELIEAAKLDGCSDARCFFSIALPLLEPGMAALAILALIFIWSEFVWSHLVLSDPSSQTLTVALYSLSSSADAAQVNYPVLLAASVVAVVPVLLIFIFFQRRFIESVSRAGIRG